jgi:hypothetical protein
MPAIPAEWRKWLYAVGMAAVPLLVAFGWLEDSVAPAVVGLIYAVLMGGLAASNVTPDAAPASQPEPEDAAE